MDDGERVRLSTEIERLQREVVKLKSRSRLRLTVRGMFVLVLLAAIFAAVAGKVGEGLSLTFHNLSSKYFDCRIEHAKIGFVRYRKIDKDNSIDPPREFSFGWNFEGSTDRKLKW